MPENTALLIGCGTVGSATARLLAEDARFTRIIVADREFPRSVGLAEALGDRVTALELDWRQEEQLTAALTGVSVVLNTSGPFSRDTLSLMRTVVEAGIPYADVNDDLATLQRVFESEYLDSLARHRGVGVLPGLGASPGQTNAVARHMAGRMDVVEQVRFFLVDAAACRSALPVRLSGGTGWRCSGIRLSGTTMESGPRRLACLNTKTLHSRLRGVTFVARP